MNTKTIKENIPEHKHLLDALQQETRNHKINVYG